MISVSSVDFLLIYGITGRERSHAYTMMIMMMMMMWMMLIMLLVMMILFLL